ncbi:DUF1707 domain-containing protein [Streptomyces sp. NPDC003717]|uniref:DUF1707 SHOCT-like domain-containing protein n=1 Tax=Streptomyces sp. NPDC003717 TaxID=3154276 RepID=UPI00339F21D3
MTPPPDDPEALLAEPDREQAVRRLQRAYADEHISHEEMDARLERALTARTRADLAPVLVALPPEPAPTTSTITAAAGRIRRRGPWRVPRTLKIESAYGKLRLDLSRAIIDHPVTDIELQLGTGGAKITVPRNATVDTEGVSTPWKDLRYRPRTPAPGPPGPTIRITGTLGFGRLRIRHARR